MAAIIENIIPRQGFEIVLERIGTILFEELTNQKSLQKLCDDFAVYIERQTPYDKSEGIVISIGMDTADYSGKNQSDRQGQTTYFIDLFTGSFQSMVATGDNKSRFDSLKWIGMISNILSSTKYKTLGFAPGLIGGTMVERIQNQLTYGNGDANFIKFARVTFTARIQENQEMWTGIELQGNDTTIKLHETEKGFKLTFNN